MTEVFTQADLREAAKELEEEDKSSSQRQLLEPLFIGLDLQQEESLENSVQRGGLLQFDFVLSKLSSKLTSKNQKNHHEDLNCMSPLALSGMNWKSTISSLHYLLKSELWVNSVVGCFNFDAEIFEDDLLFRQQIDWALYLCLPAISLPLKKLTMNHFRILNSLFDKAPTQYWIHISDVFHSLFLLLFLFLLLI